MNSTCRTAIAAAVAGGYVLGRTRKAKMAFAIGTFLAGRRFGLTPTALAAEGLRHLRESSQLADLREQIGGDLLDAARAAASTSADRRFSAFADTLRERVREEEQSAEEDGGKASGGTGGQGRKSSARKAPAKKAAARKHAPAKKAAPARKKSGPAKKTASGRSSRSTTSRSGR